METRAAHIAVGGFVLLLGAALLVFVVWLARFQGTRDIAYYDIRFSGAVTGLPIGGSVLYRGVPVGRVNDIAIDPDSSELVRVTVELDNTAPVTVETVASLEMQGITGVAYIQLSASSKTSQPLPKTTQRPYPVIKSRPSRLEELFEGAPALVAKLNTIAERIATILGESNASALGETLENLRAISAQLSQPGGLEQVLTNGAAAAEQIEAMSAEFAALAQSLRAQVDRNGDEVSRTVTELRSTSRAFGDVARQVDSIIAENRQAISDFASFGLYETTQLMTDLRLLVSQASRVATQIEREGPARFFFGNSQRGVETQ